jgi:hypothetical protein
MYIHVYMYVYINSYVTIETNFLLINKLNIITIKVPTCIACDRPLIDKVRLDTASAVDRYIYIYVYVLIYIMIIDIDV